TLTERYPSLRSQWRQWWKRLFQGSPQRRRVRPCRQCRPELEQLEEKILPSSMLTVNTANDTTAVNANASALHINGQNPLRPAIQRANVEGGDTINFNTTATGPTIVLTQGELAITASMTISGPGATALTVNGSSAGGASRIFDLTAAAAVVSIS